MHIQKQLGPFITCISMHVIVLQVVSLIFTIFGFFCALSQGDPVRTTLIPLNLRLFSKFGYCTKNLSPTFRWCIQSALSQFDVSGYQR